MRFAQNPRVGDLYPDGATARNRPRRVLREGPIGVIDGNLGDLHRLRAARPHQNLDAGLVENGSLYRKGLDRRRAVVEAAKWIE